jgi:hypothetical protein
MELLDVRSAAEQARVLSGHIYWAVRQGLLDVCRDGRRIFLEPRSFNRWMDRLNTKRQIRHEEALQRKNLPEK